MQARSSQLFFMAGLALVLSAALGGTASAQSPDLYLSIDLGVGRYRSAVLQDGVPISGGSVNKTTTVGGVAIGWQITPTLAAEIGYADFGKAKFSGNAAFPCQPAPSCTPVVANLTGNYQAKATHLSIVGTTELTKELSVFGRIGVSRTDRAVSATIGSRAASSSDKKTEAITGLGLSYAFTKSIDGTFEWKWLSDSKLNATALGVRYRF